MDMGRLRQIDAYRWTLPNAGGQRHDIVLYGSRADLEFIEERGCMRGAQPDHVSELAKRRQRGEMGTLG